MRQNCVYKTILLPYPQRRCKWQLSGETASRARFPDLFQALSSMEEFCNLDRDIEGSTKSWKKFVESECPEKEKFPQEWKHKTALQRLCMIRVLRPDRMTYALR